MRKSTLRSTAFLLGLVASVLLAGCGGTSYGNGQSFNGLNSSQAALGAATPTPAPSAATQTAPPTTAPTAHAATPPPTTKPQAQSFAIGIFGDNSGNPQFNPPAARVYTGTIIVFTNHDSVARSVVSDNGAFNSGPIAPGATWSYTASAAGTYNYHDGTRPYAVAYFQVVSP